ncbi:LRR repeats and ubiquitin-like domain-containing protein At2g30105 [Olea europaea var. sylvestris]|uniref:LRR repeats and ubiquitin-like domain-containing protein At2g30105 n=1 Tax=Olea europaea var. sylvestris TaxID=158386 RepID=UPI000C1D2A8A|nr:LRR repeats and ubiquitin-like domain-containing protein At2g30105 [Olea europaea var. sylvestris]
MASSDSQTEINNGKKAIMVNIKFSGRSIPLNITADSTVKDLKSLLQPLTNVLIRGQKLIFKGKVLSDESTLESSGITGGSKIMLMASQGLHQGDGPIKKEVTGSSSVRRVAEVGRGKKTVDSVEKSQLERWKATGVVALSESNLKTIPEEVWTCGPSARVLDLSNNSIQDVPAAIGCLSSIQKLLLNSNSILDESISWEGITLLKSLAVLSLNQNHLTTLPSSLGALMSLKQLHATNNKLTCLPTEIGYLTKLEVLKVQNNRLSSIPASIGGCISLIEVDLSCNLLLELPEEFGKLKDLKALYLSNNGLKSLPITLFKMCVQLSTLDLHGTEITADLLRQFEGWESFDERRRLKHQKQLDSLVTSSAEFDEGADKSW